LESDLTRGEQQQKFKTMYLTKQHSCAGPAQRAGHSFQDLIDRNFFGTALSRPWAITPSANVKESEKGYTIELAAPGFSKEDFTVKMEQDTLVISAEKSAEDTSAAGKYTRREYHYGTFRRAFSIPEHVATDKIGARYENGVLHVELPRKEEAAAPIREIAVA